MSQATRKPNGARIARALNHPTRVRILMSMNSPRRKLSPKEFADETGMGVKHTAYHFRELNKCGCIELVGRVPRRGATEHFYQPVARAMAWTREWESLGPVVKQNLAATALRGFIEVLGFAIDQGTFDARADSHLSWDVMRVDEEGWVETTNVLQEALEKLFDVQATCATRLGDSDGILAGYGLSCFEAPAGRHRQ